MTEVEISNLALAYIGHQAIIQSLGEASPEAAACALLYPMARDLVVQSAPWRFAKKHEALAVVSESPTPYWSWSYRYPTDCLYARFIRGATFDQRDPIPFEVTADGASGKLVWTNQAEAVLCYTRRVENAGAFDPLFADALAWFMASKLALRFTSDPRIRAESWAIYQQAIGEAQIAAMNEDQRDPHPPSAFERARA